MTGRDSYAEGREASEELRRALEAVREDVRAVVREEVAEAGLPESELERLVADLVRRELAVASGRTPRWRSPALVGVGLALGLLGGALGYRALAGGPDEGRRGEGAVAPPAATTDTGAGAERVAGAGPDAGGGPAAPGGDSAGGAPSGVASPGAGPSGGDRSRAAPGGPPGELAARYDSLFGAGSPDLEPLLTDLQGAAAAPVLEALAAWRQDPALDPGPRRRLHDALVQAAVNRLSGAGLALDGLVARGPCGGASCGAVLRLWEARGSEWGLPAYPADPPAREAALPVVERILVLRGLEAAGG